MAFEDLLLPDADVETGYFGTYTIGASLYMPVVVLDADATMFNFSTGYTATLTLNLPSGAPAVTFTNTLTSGRLIDLSPGTTRALVVTSTPAGMASLSTYDGYALSYDLIVTRSDGFAVDVMRRCYLIPQTATD